MCAHARRERASDGYLNLCLKENTSTPRSAPHIGASRIIIKFRQLIVSVDTYLIYIIIINSVCSRPTAFEIHFPFYFHAHALCSEFKFFAWNYRIFIHTNTHARTPKRSHCGAVFAHGYSDKNQSISHALHVKRHEKKRTKPITAVYTGTYADACSNKTDIFIDDASDFVAFYYSISRATYDIHTAHASSANKHNISGFCGNKPIWQNKYSHLPAAQTELCKRFRT